MNMDKKTIFAFLMIGMVLVLVNTPFYQKTFNPKGYEAKQRMLKQRQAQKMGTVADTTVITPDSTEIIIRQTKIDQEPAKAEPLPSIYSVNDTIPEEIVTVETDYFSAQFSSKGAVLTHWALKTFKDYNDDNVELLPDFTDETLGILFATKEGDTLNTSHINYKINGSNSISLSGNQSKSVKFILDFGDSKQLIKEYIFYNNTYHMDLKVHMVNMDQMIAGKAYIITAPDGMPSTEKRIKDDMQYAKAGYASGGEVNKKFKPNEKLNKESAAIDWLGVRTKYFTFTIIPESVKGEAALISGQEIPVPNSKTKAKWKKFSVSLVMPFFNQTNTVDTYKIYLGPLDNDILKSYNIHLEKFMDFGAKIIQPFSIAILWSFKKLHTIIPNYGFVLILFSILIKIIVYPLTHKSYESMQKMQALQPKLTELKEKYSNDPQKLNAATMNLYKEQKVNPLGGCLPMLLQMPLLWGLFIVFRTTIELRGEGFIWWIKDLASPDTIATLPFMIPMYGDTVNILPLFMGATMLIQQKMTITDPKQKMMVYFMPLFLTLLFNQFPSGLNLYYALFNILSIIQQKWLVPRKMAAEAVVTTPKKKKI